MNDRKVRVLVIDDDTVGDDVKLLLDPECFEVRAALGEGETLYQDGLVQAHAFRPHLAVVDLSLDDSRHDRRGIDLLGEMACGRLVYSSYANSETTARCMNEYGARVVSKWEASAAQLVSRITEVAGRFLDADGALDVTWPTGMSPALVLAALFRGTDGLPEDLVESVVWQLYRPENGNGAHGLVLAPLDGSAKTPGSISRGRGVLLRATLNGRRVPEVLKLVRRSDALAEQGNYEWIDGRTDGQFVAGLRKAAYLWDLGGLAYELLRGTPGREIKTLASFYEETAAPEQILKPVREFFTSAWLPLYQESRPYDAPLAALYADEMGGGRRLVDDGGGEGWQPSLWNLYDGWLHLDRRLHLLPPGPTLTIPGVNVRLANPGPWLEEHGWRSRLPGIRVAITHGDLHAGNLMVDADHGWAIDFERTGPNHWLRDFVELEVDIVTRLLALPSGDDLAAFLRIVTLLQDVPALDEAIAGDRLPPGLAGDAEVGKAIAVVQGLRRIAAEVTEGRAGMAEYRWGLLLDTVFAAAWAEENLRRAEEAGRGRYEVVRDRSLALAGVLCSRLEHEGPWPLADDVLPQRAGTRHSWPAEAVAVRTL